MPGAEWALTATLALHIAACAVLCGAAALRGWIAPQPQSRTGLLAGAAALVSGALLLLLQAAVWDDGDPFAGLPVALQTRFGTALLWRLGCAAAATALLARDGRWTARVAAGFAGAAAATLAATGHPAASGSAAFTAAGTLHVLAGLFWMGSLLPLWLALPAHGAAAARRYAWLGGPCVAVVAATALAQAWLLAGSPWGVFASLYDQALVAKVLLFAGLCVFAMRHFLRGTPALARGVPGAPAALRRSVLIETAMGGAIIAAAAVLSRGVPGAHAQPDWPFAWRPSLGALSEPDLAAEIAGALAAAALALVLAALAWWLRWLALAAIAAALLFWSAPSFGLLAVPAWPTSFWRSPTGLSARSVMEGATLYPKLCVPCHRADGHGGPIPGTDIPAADLMAAHLWDHSDGELFWWISHGMRDPEGVLIMPGIGDQLDDTQVWALIDYIRARNAGVPGDAATRSLAEIERAIVATHIRARSHAGGLHAHHPA